MGLYGSAPKTPDPKETASAQTATNIGTAIANGYLGNVNQVTPDGNLTYSQTGTNKWTDPLNGKTYDLPTWTATTTLSQAQQAIKNQEDAASLNLATLANTQSNRLNSLLANPFTMNGAPAAGDVSKLTAPTYQQFGSGPQLQTSIAGAGDITKSYGTDYSSNVKEVQDALMARLQPSLDQNRAALEQKLANQGLQPGSEAYDRALATATAQENDARYGAILNAGQEQTRLANLANQQATFQNAAQAQQYSQNANNASFANSANQQMFSNQNQATAGNNALKDQSFNSQQAIINAQNAARANYLNENYAQRNQNINEVLGLASGAQVSNPNFVATQGQSIPTVDYAGLVNQNYQNELAAYQQNQAGIGSLLGGLGSLFSLSDEDAKKDVEKVGGLYAYRYKGESKNAPKRIGVMAQEVEKIRPDTVRTGRDGYKRVNYGALFQAGAA
ncbi:tail fiber domain-containing protein [Aliirhizobium cellulosilyticum]|uniref:Peptidase S74 domain-containing protein n=1 Tax=Aliirhizobium cellulosilyticum TaxID=393664 RepID=A0A7W6X7N4_9HYPH|nr:tail fiber domain-containing protein [Rhizobium cellulosilyticum]MBB4347944.1 hypothetical protein [Rhizobium cellulosilyticum]MBB4409662.1 hypothetical protein [Rhizobium cellulosilyticum]MBB4444349.1 hypothetical protein [Rhizobium cellulosilyticum]